MTEIEPWLEKTLFLLNSKAEDSTEQLRLMLEESIRAKYGHKKLFLRPIPGPKPATQKKDDAALLNKKKKTDGKSKHGSGSKETHSSDTSSSNESDFTIEILEDELACVVCREISIIPHNRLVECADCHSLYHQECHNPPIEDSDVNDPRGVWYCNNCSKSLTSAKMNSSSAASSSKSSYQKGFNSSIRSGHSSQFSNKPFGGLSVPPKKSSSNSSSSSSKSSSSNGSKSLSPNMNIMNADKRLQIMKKKAAKKQEKRIIAK